VVRDGFGRVLLGLCSIRGAEQNHPRKGQERLLIMITWVIISGCTAFAVGPYSFMAIRFLLGLAEAGLFPGFVLYFTYWFPDRHRARINSGFTLALPIAVATGAPISTALLGLDGLWASRGGRS
jgi:ACS family tartrate transporter-like MFS transporter